MFQSGKNAVSFESEGVTLKGHLFLPAEYEDGKTYPTVMVTGSWTTVKEQMAGTYAQRLADEGYATLAFDFRFYGESGGEPRQYESPEAKIKDIQNAVTYLLSLPVVDSGRIGGLGICASAGYMAHAAGQDRRIKTLSLVAPWLHNSEIVKAIYGGEEGVAAKTALGTAARQKYDDTGEVDYIPAASDSDESAAMFGPFAYYLSSERGVIPEWSNSFAVMSWPEWLGFDGVSAAPTINVPILLVHSEDAAVPDGAKQFFANVNANKEIVWTEGNQFDFYDQKAQINTAVMAVNKHFEANL